MKHIFTRTHHFARGGNIREGVEAKKFDWRCGELSGSQYYYAFSNGMIFATTKKNITPAQVKDRGLVFEVYNANLGKEEREKLIKELTILFPELSKTEVENAVSK